jgi:glycosyltransferase involved in cell wall biosynthesis
LAPSGQGGPVVSLRSDFEIPDGEPIAMYVGDMSDMDGLDVLYRAVALARSFGSTLHLVIIGMGSAAYLDVLDALASELAITGHVHRVQSVPNQHLPQLFDQADVCVSPFRLRDTSSTAIPNKVLEYLTSRRPIVSTGGSALEWAFGPAIRYVPPENPQELALAVLRASSEGLTATEGVARASIHEAFAWPSILAREVDLIDRVIKDDLAGVTELDFDFSSVWVQRCLREDLDRGSP